MKYLLLLTLLAIVGCKEKEKYPITIVMEGKDTMMSGSYDTTVIAGHSYEVAGGGNKITIRTKTLIIHDTIYLMAKKPKSRYTFINNGNTGILIQGKNINAVDINQ